LSYRRTRETSTTSGPATMTVCTNDVTLRDLVQDSLPVAVPESLADIERLVATMVELQDNRIGFPAIDARVQPKERDEVHRALRDQRSLAPLRFVDVPLAIGRVMLLLVGGSTRTAVVVALPARLTTPREFLHGLALRAAAASS